MGVSPGTLHFAGQGYLRGSWLVFRAKSAYYTRTPSPCNCTCRQSLVSVTVACVDHWVHIGRRQREGCLYFWGGGGGK